MKHVLRLLMLLSLLLSCDRSYKEGQLLSQALSINSHEITAKLASAQSLSLKEIITPNLKERIYAVDGWEQMIITIPVAEHRNLDLSDALWVFLPDVDDRELKTVVAYDKFGKELTLDLKTIPAKPVITIGYDESLTSQSPIKNILTDYEGQILESISFKDVKEPWIKGSAEIYMVVTYIDKEKRGQSALIPLDGVGIAETEYAINKIFHIWESNRYQIVDVVFFEHDNNYDYKKLAKVLVDAANAVIVAIEPDASGIATIVARITKSIIDVIDSTATTDKDDYVDSLNTIFKYKNIDAFGLQQNAKMKISTMKIPAND